ncbi:PepSY-associated TM helix domain-containing protein [Spongisporangium articulatum]|uniref:PepSY-associated TM helix domain-containing protein n=1 Tax=Spongisporangium articulatum TaxID=3362603 RepID=A0ABW8ASX9_9ACTN
MVLDVTARLRRLDKWRRRKKPIKKPVIWLHRWLSLALGLVLLLITTTGAVVVYSPEWLKWTNGDVFATTQSDHPTSFSQAIATVEAAHPGFEAGSVNLYEGVIEVFAADDDRNPGFWGVDAGSGRITGHADPDRGFMAFMNQIHECFFTCDDYPGYVPWFDETVPQYGKYLPQWLQWASPRTDLTWAGFFLGSFAVILMFLALSGIWLWWPTLKKFSHGFRVRMRKGRYARDYDLHQVVGMAAVPFLLMWGLTGAGFEFNWVAPAWYAATGGQTPPDETPFTSNEVKDDKRPDIGLDAAVAAARTAGQAGDAPLVYASLPAEDDATATYSFYFSKNFDQYEHGAYPGEYGVDVDRHDPSRVHVTDLGSAATLSNQVLDNWSGALFHYGQSVNGWWRIIWFLFGLTPILLAITGVSTWLAKRSVRKRRERARAERAAAADETAIDLGDEPEPVPA